jgi:hypothetical protein
VSFYPALVKDPRFRERYDPEASRSFHAPIAGEGWYYVVVPRKADANVTAR